MQNKLPYETTSASSKHMLTSYSVLLTNQFKKYWSKATITCYKQVKFIFRLISVHISADGTTCTISVSVEIKVGVEF